jgi:hypothetical protein
MDLCLIAIFKNESHILKEWLKHYINQGVDRFFLIDNGSTDNYFEIIEPFIKTNIVRLEIDATKHKQVELYNKYYVEAIKHYKWTIVCDLDEFIYARKQYTKIKEYLTSVPDNVTQIFIPWKIFGSCGYNSLDKKQPENVVESFTKRSNYDKKNNLAGVIFENSHTYSLSKCIARSCFIKQIGIHSHLTTTKDNNTCLTSDSTIHSSCSFCQINENILEDSPLHLNHYAIQSYNWFMKVKACRGDVAGINSENVRDENYFRSFDSCSNDLVDDELANLK